MSLDYNKKNIVLAKNLRKNATPRLCFTNSQIDDNFIAVCKYIDSIVKDSAK